jgi:hypothetical protein
LITPTAAAENAKPDRSGNPDEQKFAEFEPHAAIASDQNLRSIWL